MCGIKVLKVKVCDSKCVDNERTNPLRVKLYVLIVYGTSDKDSKCVPRLTGEPNLMTPKFSKEVNQISKSLTPVTTKNSDLMTPKSSTSKPLTPVTLKIGRGTE